MNSIKILAAEDNFINQRLLEKIFLIKGWEIKVVVDGQQVIEEASRNTYDIILMDIRMPVIDGFKATREIRKMNITTPIIAVTANAFAGFREECLLAGMNDFVSKPFKKEKLFEIIEKYINCNK
jgi:CheY-like chemotaxis protein